MRKILLSLALLSTVISAWAQNNTLVYTFNSVDQTATVTWVKDKDGKRIHYSGDIVIPDEVTYNDVEYKVTQIAPTTFYENKGVTSVVIGQNVKQIGGSAFRYCSSLTSISIPASVDTIGEWAFSNTGLKDVKFEDGDAILKLWDWSGYCIFESSPLETVYLGRNYISGGRPFRGFKTMKSVTVSDVVTSLQPEEFKDSRGIRDVRLGESITSIGKAAFQNCDTLVAVTLPESLITIGENAFYDCDTLSFINIPTQVSLIEGSAFRYCPHLGSIEIPASMDSIGAWAFSNTGLKNVKFEDGDATLKLWDWSGYCIFESSPLETVYLGRNYISGGRPFRGFKTMKNVTVSDVVTSLQPEEFKDSRGIRDVKLGGNITSIGKAAFQNCDTLVTVTLPESLITIGESAFYDCDTLSFINIPSQVSLIEGSAFRYCPHLGSISIPASVDSIGAWAFCDTGLKNVRFEDGDATLNLWDWGGYCIFDGSPLETVYLGRNYISNGRPFRGFKTMKSVTVSDVVTSLQTEEFKDSRGIRDVKLGGNITSIGIAAFQNCDTLVAITLPESLITIGESAFYDCDTLSFINIPSQVSLIEGYAFRYCKHLESISIPASVDSIGAWTFCDTGLKEVKIEDGESTLNLWDWGGYCIFDGSPLETLYLGRNYISGVLPFRGIKTLKVLSLGSSIESLNASEFENCQALERIYSYNPVPPTCGNNRVFNGVNKQTCLLLVPDMSIDLYKAAPVWSEFFNIESGIKDILTDREKADVTNGVWFNMNGQQMDNLQPGMNILRREDGKAVKIFVR